MPQVSHLNAKVSLWSRCREWQQTKLRAAFEASMLDEDDEEGTARIVDLAHANLLDIEAAIAEAARDIPSIDDVQAVLGIALAILQDEDLSYDHEGRAPKLLRAVRYGLNGLRNAIREQCDAAA